jgi:hypothetical protein
VARKRPTNHFSFGASCCSNCTGGFIRINKVPPYLEKLPSTLVRHESGSSGNFCDWSCLMHCFVVWKCEVFKCFWVKLFSECCCF